MFFSHTQCELDQNYCPFVLFLEYIEDKYDCLQMSDHQEILNLRSKKAFSKDFEILSEVDEHFCLYLHSQDFAWDPISKKSNW